MKKSIGLIALLIIIGLTGCKKIIVDSVTSKINDAIGSMTVTVDGSTYKAFTAVNIVIGGLVDVEGIAQLSAKSKSMSVIIKKKVEAGKTYSSSSTTPDKDVEIRWKDLTLSTSNYSSANEGGSAIIKIKTVTDKQIDGTFSGTVVEDGKTANKLVVKNGVFSVKYLLK